MPTKGCATCIARFANRAGAAIMRTTSSSDPAAFAKSNSSSRRCSSCAVAASRRCVVRGTLPALAAMRVRGLLPAAAAAELVDAYAFLRKVEHRLQYRDDAQTQRPARTTTPIARRWPRAMACSDAARSMRLLDRHRDNVDAPLRRTCFGAADSAPPSAIRSPSVWIAPAPEDAHLAALRRRGLRRSTALIVDARARAESRALSAIADAPSRQRFDALVPQLAAARGGGDVGTAQTVFERLLCAAGDRSAGAAPISRCSSSIRRCCRASRS